MCHKGVSWMDVVRIGFAWDMFMWRATVVKFIRSIIRALINYMYSSSTKKYTQVY
jgi:hypothetical protein